MKYSKHNYAFIDSQNVHLGVKSLGWRLDYRRFRVYLTDKYGVEKAFLFLGYLPENEPLYQTLRSSGFELIFKPTLRNSKGVIKGNVDAELVLHTMIEYPNFDQAVLVSSDGDFACLVSYLYENKKLHFVLCPSSRKCSSLLKAAGKNKVFFFEHALSKFASMN